MGDGRSHPALTVLSAAVLEAEGIRPKRGDRWHPETVRRMLANQSDQPPTLRPRSSK